MPAANPSGRPAVEFDLSAIPDGREDIARLIVKSFADAGFGAPQQLAALANAIAESGLDPNAATISSRQEMGLFQLNTATGLGAGNTVAELKDPATNIGLMVSAAQKVDEFKAAVSLEDAVSIFVHKIERPADPAGQTARRLKIAEQIRRTG
jgi:hypothetical protein